MKSKRVVVPDDAAKLRASRPSLERILSTFRIPSAFVHALSRYYLPAGRGHYNIHFGAESIDSELWYTLPIRMQVGCTDAPQCHITSNSGSNQMNPFHYLHLPDPAVDIRRSLIALSFRYSRYGNSTCMLAVNFIDGRWPKTAQEPELRIKEVLGDSNNVGLRNDPFFIHLVYLFSATRWWTNALTSFTTN